MITSINKQILDIYSRYNPSIPRDISKKLRVINDLFNFKLNFPIKNFKKKNIIDVACGSGEFAAYLSLSGHNVTGYDFNEKSINMGKKLAKKLGVKNSCKFRLSEFYKVKQKADIVVCTAALHHLDDPYKGLKHLSKLLNKGGYLILSFGLDLSLIHI